MPPYAKRWRANPPAGSVSIFVGEDAWNRADDSRKPMVLPVDANPTDFDWSFLRGHDAVVIQFGAAPATQIEELTIELLRYGIEPVVVVREPHYFPTVHRITTNEND